MNKFASSKVPPFKGSFEALEVNFMSAWGELPLLGFPVQNWSEKPESRC